MSYTYTNTSTQTFTLTHAKYLTSKVTADLKRVQRLYGSPSDSQISDYEGELIEYLKNGYLAEVTYGYKRDDKWIEPTLKYTAKDLAGMSSEDEDPGRVRPNANIEGAFFYSYLVSNTVYDSLTATEKENFKNSLPIQRAGAPAPGISGYMSSDKTYSSGGRALNRSSLKSY